MPKRFRPVPANSYISSPFGPRWGTQHRGTDFGRAGGSANMPVYAAQGGKVVYAGAASGFGGPDPAGWLVVDHPTADGSGTTVYGHIIREVGVGQRVEAGQRIGRVNPNPGSNGGVAPHLHFEVHPTVWRQGSQIDPVAWLGNAPSPDGGTSTPPSSPAGRVLYGVDLSEHQRGISLSQIAKEGFSFAILRLCDGTYQDKQFGTFLPAAERAGLLVSTYWYLRAPSEGTSIAQQVDVIDRQMNGRRDLGVWIDVESVDRAGRKLLTGSHVKAAKAELESRGYFVPGIYTGRWYWEHMPGGEPSMAGLGALWCSHYGRHNATGFASTLYAAEGGNAHPGWSYPLGDRKPDILQFGSNGKVAGQLVDVNAFRGTRDQLAGLFRRPKTSPAAPAAKPQPNFLEVLMSDRVASRINPEKDFPGNVALSLVDEAAWQTRALLYSLYEVLGLDADATIDAAIAADRAGKSWHVPAIRKES